MGAEAPLVDPQELPGWVLVDDADTLVVNKPGWLVCHPSKNGPLSSLVGACRQWKQLETLHLVARLDRETSGVVVMARHRQAARRLQMALQERRVQKTYLAVLHGHLPEPVEVRQPLAKDLDSPVSAKVTVRQSRSAKPAHTVFEPLVYSTQGEPFTFARITPVTGRKHQIRAHAWWLGHGVAADKLYGTDDTRFLEFIEAGWTPKLAAQLPMSRQALHAARLEFEGGPCFEAGLPEDLAALCQRLFKQSPEALLSIALERRIP
jgi:23S rRNA pseudouridine1911/1915/1917 synthase